MHVGGGVQGEQYAGVVGAGLAGESARSAPQSAGALWTVLGVKGRPSP